MTYSLNGVAPLSHLGVIRAEGEDAAEFLHGQLTQDFALLGMNLAVQPGPVRHNPRRGEMFLFEDTPHSTTGM